MPFPCGVEEGQLSITTSIGGALIQHGNHSTHVILDRADKCLYEAKDSGRNCTVFEDAGKLDPEKFKEQKRETIE